MKILLIKEHVREKALVRLSLKSLYFGLFFRLRDTLP